MRGIITTLLLLAVPVWICAKIFGPTEELSTWQWVVFAGVSILTFLVILFLSVCYDASDSSDEESGTDDRPDQ